MKRILLNNL